MMTDFSLPDGTVNRKYFLDCLHYNEAGHARLSALEGEARLMSNPYWASPSQRGAARAFGLALSGGLASFAYSEQPSSRPRRHWPEYARGEGMGRVNDGVDALACEKPSQALGAAELPAR